MAANWTITDEFTPGLGGSRHVDLYIGEETGPGFTGRLSATLRDRQGLAYTVNATITPSAGDQPGTFTGYIGTFPDKFTWVRDGFLKEINKLRSDELRAGQELRIR